MKRLIVNKMLFLLLLCISVQLWGQAPEGYYDAAKGQKDKALLIALHNIIDGHTNVGYDGLWTVYKKSDVRADGTVWDMYSTSKFIPVTTKMLATVTIVNIHSPRVGLVKAHR